MGTCMVELLCQDSPKMKQNINKSTQNNRDDLDTGKWWDELLQFSAQWKSHHLLEAEMCYQSTFIVTKVVPIMASNSSIFHKYLNWNKLHTSNTKQMRHQYFSTAVKLCLTLNTYVVIPSLKSTSFILIVGTTTKQNLNKESTNPALKINKGFSLCTVSSRKKEHRTK